MCGRFILLSDLSAIVERFGIEEVACEYRTGDNIFPGQEIATVIHRGRNELVSCRWGLIPSWARDPSAGGKLFNARAETVAQKPSFREAFQNRRCLIPADGFYEWQKSGRVKKPFLLSLKSREPFGFAGLYETWVSPEKRQVHTCTIVTTAASDLVRPIHDRMPVIVKRGLEQIWIDPDRHDSRELEAVLKPFPAAEMEASETSVPSRAANAFIGGEK